MKAVLQRVKCASVLAKGTTVASIGPGWLILLGVLRGDTMVQAELLARKVAQLRAFADEDGKLNRSLLEAGGAALVVSNFTLGADCRKGRRPSFVEAAGSEQAQPLYLAFAQALTSNGVQHVQTGVFGAQMQIESLADGPVTLLLDTRDWEHPKTEA